MSSRSKVSQGQSRAAASQRKLANAPARNFLRAHCDPAIERNVRRDLKILLNAFPFKQMGPEHPVYRLWTTPTSMARFQLQHVADDLHELRNVDGVKSLVKRLVEDPEAFEDYRYELRVAAMLARSGKQKILHLAGPSVGPDIEFESQSGQTIGIACYRANSAIPAIAEASRCCARVTESFLQTFRSDPLPVDLAFEVIFQKFPANVEDEKEAALLLPELWKTLDTPELEGPRGVRVNRVKMLASSSKGSLGRRVRIRYMFPVPVRESTRVALHITEKLQKEDRQWANKYKGKCLFAVEETRFAIGFKAEELRRQLSDAPASFSGILATQMMYEQQQFGRMHSLESVAHYVADPEIQLHLESLGNNFSAISKFQGVVPVQFKESFASELWDAWCTSDGAAYARAIKPLAVSVGMTKVPYEGKPELIGQDEAFWQRFEVAVGELQAHQQAVFDD